MIYCLTDHRDIVVAWRYSTLYSKSSSKHNKTSYGTGDSYNFNRCSIRLGYVALGSEIHASHHALLVSVVVSISSDTASLELPFFSVGLMKPDAHPDET